MKQNLNEQISRIKDMMGVKLNESGFPVPVRMTIFSHLSDISDTTPGLRDRINYIKVLVSKFIPENIEINTDQLDQLWQQVSNGDFSGSALETSGPEFGGKSGVEDDDYDERMERNYGVEDLDRDEPIDDVDDL